MIIIEEINNGFIIRIVTGKENEQVSTFYARGADQLANSIIEILEPDEEIKEPPHMDVPKPPESIIGKKRLWGRPRKESKETVM